MLCAIREYHSKSLNAVPFSLRTRKGDVMEVLGCRHGQSDCRQGF
jgi:hypothetical protein